MALETENGDERGKAHGILNEQNIEPDMQYYAGTATMIENIDNQKLKY